MSSIYLESNASGTGTFTIASPNSNSNYTLTLPTETGTVLTSGGAIDVNASAPADSVVIDSSGNVGIGTSSVFYKLQVKPATNVNIGFDNGGASSCARISAINDALNANTDLQIQASNVLFNNAGNELMRITAGGEVYIAGTTDQGAYNLQCNGTGVWGAGAYVNGSDERIKDDIEPIASGLDVVEKLNPVTYRYKESWTKDQSVQTGFIAQELLTALDGQVYVDGVVQQGGSENYYSVAYQNIIPILTKAIQELKAELDEAKARIASLEGNVNA